MMLIPISGVPSQTLQFVVANQNCQMNVYTNDGYDYSDATLSTPQPFIAIDFAYNGIQVTNTQNCLNEKRLLVNRQYLGFMGDFMFVDSQGTDDPEWAGLGTRWFLLYLEASDLP
jgi:hypothetical protein